MITAHSQHFSASAEEVTTYVLYNDNRPVGCVQRFINDVWTWGIYDEPASGTSGSEHDAQEAMNKLVAAYERVVLGVGEENGEITLKNGDTLHIQYRTDGEQIDPDSVVVRKNPPSAKFKVNDRVQPKWWPDNTLEEWKAGTILTVYEAHWDNVNGYWSYIVSDDIIVRGTTEDNLELFKE